MKIGEGVVIKREKSKILHWIMLETGFSENKIE
jgi:hypothetical protein